LIAFDENYRLVLSPRLKAEMPQRAIAENFGTYEGEPLQFPEDATPPDLAFLAQHRGTVFRKA